MCKLSKHNYLIIILIFVQITLFSCTNNSSIQPQEGTDSSHPKLVLTQKGVQTIRKNLGNIPLFDETLAIVKEEIDAEIIAGIQVPIPKDLSGGYTHEQHKKNFLMMQKAGVLYQILDDDTYAEYVKNMLFEYAEMYPKLPVHPQTRSYARGKLFWQCLNDSNWLVYSSQAYDCIYNYLSEEERTVLESDLFRPFADFISKGNPQFFNRVHNHSTWGNVAVGMIALVMDDDSLLQKALYGLKTDNLQKGMKDNDGGFIQTEGQKVGFFANLDEPFSPDGYYTEGPYYQRYAMYPFLIFAEALHNNRPDLNIFQYKDSVLLKGVDALINLSDADGEFFTLNDAQKGMSYYSKSLVSSVDIAYHFGGNNPELLSIAEKQHKVTLDDAGFAVALGIKEGKAKPFDKKSIELSDGANGDEGAVGILRSGPMELVYKYSAHGLSHGHFDKLSYSLFDDGEEVVQDYGLARYVNIEQKGGGNYLKENKTWAKQTIAHNTIVQNENSHFQGKYEIGSKHHSEKYLFSVDDKNLKVASAKEENAYPGTQLHRTMVTIKDEDYPNPYVLDIMKVTSNKTNQYDLPFYYLGQIMQTSFDYTKLDTPQIFGKSNGYQHLFKEAQVVSNGKNLKLNWLLNNKFYSYSSVTSKNDEIILARIGANDPAYNLRSEPALILRKKDTKDFVFASIIESHGTYSPVSEFAVNAYSNINNISVVSDSKAYTAIQIETNNNKTRVFVISNINNDPEKEHQATINSQEITWKGAYTLIEK
ncbi:MAG: alginate lyase family protein [Lutibacter sp.]|uniref:alginate lyase family protein n=1 Tax=Lutibacter sp. TaxID=1925666 RepID=UPI0017B1A52C|nr:alginate lyase family protein [Lutibacter sp.]MBT8316046.1 heparinase II/III family protein [Lutibacter sp.]NNJ56906.1 alginate lyase family protein [Lutibacter sp.]